MAKDVIVIDCGLYPVSVIFCRTRKAYGKQAQKLGIEPYDIKCSAGVTDHSCVRSHGVILMGVFDGAGATLTHELFHVVVRALGRVGVTLEHNKPNEAYAYLLGYLYRPCAKFLVDGLEKSRPKN